MGIQGQLQEKVRNAEKDRTYPELNCLSPTSENLRILVSWQACLACCSWQAQPYRCALGFRPRKWVPPFPRKYSREREKHWQQLGALDPRNGETPPPAYTLLCANTQTVWELERLGGWDGRGRRILCRWGRERKQQSQLFHPGLSPHYRHIFFHMVE